MLVQVVIECFVLEVEIRLRQHRIHVLHVLFLLCEHSIELCLTEVFFEYSVVLFLLGDALFYDAYCLQLAPRVVRLVFGTQT